MTEALAFDDREPRPSGPWQELGPAPGHRPVHTAIARGLFLRVAPHLSVRVRLPDGRIIGGGGPDAPLMRVRSDAFFRRLGADGLIGFGEAFMAGDWDADDPAAVLAPFAARMSSLVPAWMQRLRRLYVRRPPAREQNTKAGARRNIDRHYDLSNDLFALFLDESMTYSCARFAARRLPGARPGPQDRRAPRRHRRRSRDAPARGRHRLGRTGGPSRAAAARPSPPSPSPHEQAALARERAARAGVTNRVDVQLRDYREVEGCYDAVVSVEMIEAVGTKFWPTFFRTLDRVLAPGGRVGIQAILLAHDRMLATRDQYTWINKYVFPGGALPSLRAIDDVVADTTTLQVEETVTFGADYARTLRAWRERFDAHATEVDELGFDATFRRMWDFYLAYCEAGFATGYLDVAQIVLARR